MTASTIADVSCLVMSADLTDFDWLLRGGLGLGGRPLGSGELDPSLNWRASPSKASAECLGLEALGVPRLGIG